MLDGRVLEASLGKPPLKREFFLSQAWHSSKYVRFRQKTSLDTQLRASETCAEARAPLAG